MGNPQDSPQHFAPAINLLLISLVRPASNPDQGGCSVHEKEREDLSALLRSMGTKIWTNHSWRI